jgi:hypothetical protein
MRKDHEKKVDFFQKKSYNQAVVAFKNNFTIKIIY